MGITRQAPDWAALLTPAAAHTQKSLIRDMFKRLRKGDITSFAGGMPDTNLFPYAELEKALGTILSDKALRVTALNYGPSEGYLPLRQWISEHMQSLGVTCSSDNILLTSGGQQALDLICRALISPGDKIIVAAPTYLGALQIMRTYGADIISIQTDDEGPLPDSFEAALNAGAKFAYLVSDFSNPTGLSISEKRRIILIKLARRKGVPIVDDAAYQQLRFDGKPILPMMALNQKAYGDTPDHPLENSGVLHVGTFSKTMMPGLRVGWIVAPKPFLKAVIPLKQATDLHSPLLSQMMTYQLTQKIYNSHIALLRYAYGRKRDCMISAMQNYLPEGLNFTKPEGGMFVWVSLPDGFDAVNILDHAMEEAKVAYIPGNPFFADPKAGMRYCRFSFSGGTEQSISEGIERFGDFIVKII